MKSKYFKKVGAMLLSVALFAGALSVTAFTQTVTVRAEGAWPYNYTDENGVQYGESLTYLDQGVFYGCEKLEEFALPDSLKNVYESAFQGTGYYNNVKNWKGNGLYLDGWLLTVREGTTGYFKIAAGTKRMGVNLFCKGGSGAGVTKIGIPASLEGDQPHFSDRGSSIRSSAVNKDNPYYSYKDGVLYNKDQTKMLEVVGKLPKIYTIPSGVEEIGSRAFRDDCTAKAIVIPKTVKRMERGALASVSRKTGLLCEAKQRPAGWDEEWAVTEDEWLMDEFAYGNIHFGYREKPVTAVKSLYKSWTQEKPFGKTITFDKGDQWDLGFTPKSGGDGYVRWASTNPSVLKVTQNANYTKGFQVDAKKSGTVWLKAKNSKGKVIAQYKVRVVAKKGKKV